MLVGRDGAARLADFGLSIDASSELPNTRLGTCGYFAPEVLDCPRKRTPFELKERGEAGTPDGYSSAIDIWSAGVLLFEVLTGRAPFAAPSPQAVVEAIRARPVVFPAHLSAEAAAFLSELLQRDPSARATARGLLAHPFIVRHCGPPEPPPPLAPAQAAAMAAAAAAQEPVGQTAEHAEEAEAAAAAAAELAAEAPPLEEE